MADRVSDKSLSDLVTGGPAPPPKKIKMSELRAQFPMYDEIPDEQLLIAVKRKFYPDMPMGQLAQRVDFDTERARLNNEILADMGFTGQFAAGVGKSASQLWRSAKRLGNMAGIGDYDQQQAEADAEIDKPLESTVGGTLGSLAGDVMLTAIPGAKGAQLLERGIQTGARVLPRAVAAVTRGAAPYLGQAGAGAVQGALSSPADMGSGAALGGAFGAGGELAGRVVSAGAQGIKSLVEPLWQSGRERVLKRTLENAATNLPNVRNVLQAGPDAGVLVPGTRPTLAEVTEDPGLIQMQRGAQSMGGDVTTAIDQSNIERVGAYRQQLQEMAGGGGAREAAERQLQGQGQGAYERVFAMPVDLENATPEVAAAAEALLRRPSIQRALPAARASAAERGVPFDETSSMRGLHDIKTALDREIGELRTAGKYTGDVEATRDALMDLMDDVSGGAYGAARRQYAQLARPVNQMDVAQHMYEKGFPALGEYNANLVMSNPGRFTEAMRQGESTVRRATGMNMPLEQMMEPQQYQSLQRISADMARAKRVAEGVKAPGSPTAQYMAAQNVLRRVIGPLGMPESWVQGQIGKILQGIGGLPYRWTEPDLQRMLAQALTDPQVARRLLETPDPASVAEILRPYAAQAAIQLGNQ